MLRFIFQKILKGEKLTDEELAFLLDWAGRAEVLTVPVNETNTTPLDLRSLRVVDNYIQGRANINNLGVISNQMGLQIAGEFRTGNGRVPGDGFSGGRFGYPGFTYGGVTYFLAGVQNDILQVGLALADGSVYFGAGTGWLNSGGIQLVSEGLHALNNGYKFVDSADQTKIVGGVYQIVRHVYNDSYTELRAQTQDATIATVYASVDAVAPSVAVARLTADSGANAGAAAVLKVVQTATGLVSFENVDKVQMAVNDRIEFGADHYIAFRGSSNPNTYFNEANQDMDTLIRSLNNDYMFVVDAGLDGVGIGGAAESGYALKVTGDLKVTGTLNATFLFPLATYVDLNPITTTGKYPYAGTADRNMDFVRLVQAVYSSAAHDSSNYYTLTLKLRQEGASDVTVCSVDTKNLTTSTMSGYVDTMTTTTFTTASMAGTGYIYMEVTKTGSPADIIVPCPALLCRG